MRPGAPRPEHRGPLHRPVRCGVWSENRTRHGIDAGTGNTGPVARPTVIGRNGPDAEKRWSRRGARLDDGLTIRQRKRAAGNGLSMEEEARRILREADRKPRSFGSGSGHDPARTQGRIGTDPQAARFCRRGVGRRPAGGGLAGSGGQRGETAPERCHLADRSAPGYARRGGSGRHRRGGRSHTFPSGQASVRRARERHRRRTGRGHGHRSCRVAPESWVPASAKPSGGMAGSQATIRRTPPSGCPVRTAHLHVPGSVTGVSAWSGPPRDATSASSPDRRQGSAPRPLRAAGEARTRVARARGSRRAPDATRPADLPLRRVRSG